MILRSTGDESWAKQPPAHVVLRHHGAGRGRSEGTILHYDGSSWTTQPSGTTTLLIAVWGASASDIYAAGHEGVMLHSTGNGTWTPQDSGTTQHLFAVWGASATELYASGMGNSVLRSTGDGTWTSEPTGAATTILQGDFGTGAGDLYAVGDAGLILHGTP